METVGVPARLIRLGPKPALVELIGIKMLQSFSSSFFLHTHIACTDRLGKKLLEKKYEKRLRLPPVPSSGKSTYLVHNILLQEQEVFGTSIEKVFYIFKFPNPTLMEALKEHFGSRIKFYHGYPGPQLFQREEFTSRTAQSPPGILVWDDASELFTSNHGKRGQVEIFTELLHHRSLICFLCHQGLYTSCNEQKYILFTHACTVCVCILYVYRPGKNPSYGTEAYAKQRGRGKGRGGGRGGKT